MRKALLISTLVTSLPLTAQAELEPFVGLNLNGFSISADNIRSKSSNGFSSVTLSGSESSDSGGAIGLNFGAYLDGSKKINLQYFSGEEDDSSVFSATFTSLSFDYIFNASKPYKGWFLGAGLVSFKIENENRGRTYDTLKSNSSSATGLLLRGGYTHKFDNKVILEVGLNANVTSTTHTVEGTLDGANIALEGDFSVGGMYLGVNYAF